MELAPLLLVDLVLALEWGLVQMGLPSELEEVAAMLPPQVQELLQLDQVLVVE
jgi:hypothetical protein